jgi:hypothetical protein
VHRRLRLRLDKLELGEFFGCWSLCSEKILISSECATKLLDVTYALWVFLQTRRHEIPHLPTPFPTLQFRRLKPGIHSAKNTLRALPTQRWFPMRHLEDCDPETPDIGFRIV